MIYTSYFAKANKLPDNVIPIAICAKAPEGYKGLQYKKLAPSYSILLEWKATHDEDLYVKRFSEEILGKLSFDDVMRDIAQMTPDGKDCCLLCYEKSSDFCHRHLVADWIIEHGLDCREFDFEKIKELEQPVAEETKPLRVIVAGSRDFKDYKLLCAKLDFYLSQKTDIEIVSGCARGADSLAIQYAAERGYPVKKFPANWDLYGKSAGYRRNAEMAEYADAVVVFWDGKSKGTKHMIDLAEDKGLAVRIVKFQPIKEIERD